MRLAALWSGGKDSAYAALLAARAGHEIKYLVTVRSANPDSWMWHTATPELTKLQAKAAGITLAVVSTAGEREREFDELKGTLRKLDIKGVVAGAIASRYQKDRIERICNELGLKLITPLWGRDPEQLLQEMLTERFEIIFTAVAAAGFDSGWLGRKLDERAIEDLKALNKGYGVHMSGEGGEYETALLGCPLFEKRLAITRAAKIWNSETGSGRLVITGTVSAAAA